MGKNVNAAWLNTSETSHYNLLKVSILSRMRWGIFTVLIWQKIGNYCAEEYLHRQYDFDQLIVELNENIQIEREIEKASAFSEHITVK